MPREVYRFGSFELNTNAFQLRDGGMPIRLERRPLELLILLVRRRGELIARDEIVRLLWGEEVFVEAEAGIHTAIRKIRRALNDPPKGASYIETVPGKGYRFIAPLQRESPPRYTTVAVLPVHALDRSPEGQYLAEGITEEVIAALGQVSPDVLRVIGRTTMMRYRETEESLAAIGRTLRAEFLVESSMRSDGAQLRLTSRLVRATDQIQLWCASFDGDCNKSVLQFQRELSQAVAAEIRSELSPERLDSLARRHPPDPAAYDFYLRGRYLWYQLSAETTRRAIECYRRATAIEPGYGLAWAGLAVAFAAAPITGDIPTQQMLAPAREAAAEAIQNSAELAESHTAEGFVRFWLDWDLAAAEAAFRRAIAIDGSDALAHRTLGIVLAYQNRPEEAKLCARRACELDPLNAGHWALAAQVALFGRDFETSRQMANRAIEIDSTFWVGHLQFAQAAEQLGDYDAALKALQQAELFGARNSKVLALRGYVQARMGHRSEAEALLAEVAQPVPGRFLPPYAPALIAMGLGDTEQALQHLERAFQVRDLHLTFLLADPKWDTLRADSRCQDLIFRCRFAG